MKPIQEALQQFDVYAREAGLSFSLDFYTQVTQSIQNRFEAWQGDWIAEELSTEDPLYWDVSGFIQYWNFRVQGKQFDGMKALCEIISRQLPPKSHAELIEIIELYFVPPYFQFRYLNELRISHPQPNRVVVLESVIRFPTYILNPFDRAGKDQSSYLLNILQAVGGGVNFHVPKILSKLSCIRHLLQTGVMIYDVIPIPVSGIIWTPTPWMDVKWEEVLIQGWGKINEDPNPLMTNFIAALRELGGLEVPRNIAVLHKRIFETLMRHRLVPQASEKLIGMAMVSKSSNLSPDAQAIRDIFSGKPRRNDFVQLEDRTQIQVVAKPIHFSFAFEENESSSKLNFLNRIRQNYDSRSNDFNSGTSMSFVTSRHFDLPQTTSDKFNGTIYFKESLYAGEIVRLQMFESPECDGDGVDVNINALDALKYGELNGRKILIGINPKHILYADAKQLSIDWNYLPDTKDFFTDEQRKEIIFRILDGYVSRFNRPVLMGKYIPDDVFLKHLEQVVADCIVAPMQYETAYTLIESRMLDTLPAISKNPQFEQTQCLNGIRLGREAIMSLMQETRIPDPGVLFFYDFNSMASARFEWFHQLMFRLRKSFVKPEFDTHHQRLSVWATLQEAMSKDNTQMYLWVHNMHDYYIQKDEIDPKILVLRRVGSKTNYFIELEVLQANPFARKRLQALGFEVEEKQQNKIIETKQFMVSNETQQIKRFYELLDQVQKKCPRRVFGELSSTMPLPQQGVYFFFEPGEYREDGKSPRVVRIGTHAAQAGSSASVFSRIKNHWGSNKEGHGKHRMSVHRELVGLALINRDQLNYPHWKDRKYKDDKLVIEQEKELELKVSEYIRACEFTVLEVPGESHANNDRSFIEANAIALLSNYGRDEKGAFVSSNWLGKYNGDDRLVQSGLWNKVGVFRDVHPEFLDRFEVFVNAMGDYTKAGVKKIGYIPLEVTSPTLKKSVTITSGSIVIVYETIANARTQSGSPKKLSIANLEARPSRKSSGELISVNVIGKKNKTYFVRMEDAPEELIRMAGLKG
jgi:hypothetical protein